MEIALGEMVEEELDTMMVRRTKKVRNPSERGSVEGSRRRQTGKHILHMWEGKPQAPRGGNTTFIDTIGRTRMEQEADKA